MSIARRDRIGIVVLSCLLVCHVAIAAPGNGDSGWKAFEIIAVATMGIISVFMKYLHDRIVNSASKKELDAVRDTGKVELANAMLAIAEQRREDRGRDEDRRREDQDRLEKFSDQRRQNEAKMFGVLDTQNVALARIEAEVKQIRNKG